MKCKTFLLKDKCIYLENTHFPNILPQAQIFHKNHKKTIEIACCFVYNVFITVKYYRGPRKEIEQYVHCKCYSQRLLAGTQRQR